ncbi:MAG: sulfatase [Kofleriaceae bacterium]
MDEARSPSAPSVGAAFLSGAACALVAALALAVVDGLAAGGGAMLTVFGLWAFPALAFAGYAGAVAAGFRAWFGPGALAGLVADRDRDDRWTGVVIAALVVGLAVAVAIPIATTMIVAKAHRPEAGARVMGALTMLVAIGAGVAMLPVAALARAGARKLPRVPGLSNFVVFLGLAVVVVLVYARRRLYSAGFDNAALPMGALAEVALLPVVTLILGALAHGPLAGVRRRLPARGALTLAGLALAMVLGVVVLRGQPSPGVARAVTEHGLASRTLVTVMQSLSDHDGDGYSAFFRGPDCDDHDPLVNPAAKEIAGNGKDDNCQGGDRAAEPTGPSATDGPDAGVATAPTPPLPGPRRNVVIVMIDTLRADRLGAAGYQRDGKSMTPRMDAFLGQAVWFTHTYAQANNTPRSMPSFMASRYPSLVKVDNMHAKYPRLDDANQLLFEQLQAAGLTTVGHASHFYFRDERNFAQGFDRFDNAGALDIGPSNKDSAAPRIVPRVVADFTDLKAAGKPFAMFVHLFEPHSSWVEHEGMPPITETGSKAHGQRYDYEVAFVDGYFGQLLDGLAAAGLADDTVVVLMSDHGESFGDHNFAGQSFFHGTNLYDEQLRVPFAFRVPGAAPRKIDAVTQLLDLAPTVAALTGAAPSPDWLGRSLAPAIAGETMAAAPAFAELLPYPGWEHDLKMAVDADGAWKLINILSQRRSELYDLSTDPGEKQDRWSDPAAAEAKARMQQLMLDWVEVTLAK